MDLLALFVLAMVSIIIVLYYIVVKQVPKSSRDYHLEILNFIIPILTLFTILVTVLTYIQSNKQSQDNRELTFGFNNEARLSSIMNALSTCSISSKDYCNQTLFKTQTDTIAFYLLETLENALIQKRFKITSEYDIRWLNIIRKLLKDNPAILEFWDNSKGYYSPEMNEWIENEKENGFKPTFFPRQKRL